MRGDITLPAPLRGERAVVVACVAAITLLSWLYLVALADAMDAMSDGRSSVYMSLMPMGRWGAHELAVGFAMWAVMMIAMMAPSAAPMLLAFHALVRPRLDARAARGRAAAFLLGYVFAWTGFSVLATALQWGLHEWSVVTDRMVSSSRLLDAGLMLVAGTWQLLPAKATCLSKCRTPFGFLVMEWREGARGAVLMGLRHGLYCTGCCWALMLLLFAAGVMNLAWIAILSLVVLVEKLVPRGMVFARISGVALCAGGVWLLMKAA
jgi:predicted metal-binding membrane protein